MNPRLSLQIATLLAITLLAACTQPSSTSEETTLSSFTRAPVPGDDAPELARLGDYRVGVQTVEFEFEATPEISLLGYGTGYTPESVRRLSVDILYPADISRDVPADAIYPGIYQTGLTDVQGLPEYFEIHGIAVRNAPPLAGTRFPLVVFSHGYFTTPGVMSGITENLASKGYVVASIDHNDNGSESDTPVHRFARAVLNRSLDQQRIHSEMVKLKEQQGSVLGQIIDTDTTALIGYSMGGYGVINHAGAGYLEEGSAFDLVPGDLMADQLETSADFLEKNREHIKAIVAIAPWGGVKDQAWSDEALGSITAPAMILAGSEDDVSRFDDGIQRLFNEMRGTERYMLVFQNARHNLAQVPAPPSAHLDVVPWQTFEEPVWRRERLLSVSNHFITAFLDLNLKGNHGSRVYLDLPTTNANDATWQQPFAVDYSDRYADGTDGSEKYWRGFKRRQAVGMELHRLAVGD